MSLNTGNAAPTNLDWTARVIAIGAVVVTFLYLWVTRH